MSLAKLTMIGFNNYLNKMYNQSLFDLMDLPEGIDKETLCDNIILQGGEFEVLYADPEFMRSAINVWSKKCYDTFSKWVSALKKEYDPLENYDRIEDWQDSGNRGLQSTTGRSSNNTRTFDNQDKRTIDTQNQRSIDTDTTTENTVSAFDSSEYQPSEKTQVDNGGTDTMNNTGTDTVDYSGTIEDELFEGATGSENESNITIHGGRIHGNIGVTTSQQMLQAELDVRRFNLIDQITDMFILEFCIPIYD